jgi:hypothetical protein
MVIPLDPPLPAGSSSRPESSDGQPSCALLFGLAPGGVCLASDVTTGTGELLPHRFTLTRHSTPDRFSSGFAVERSSVECRAVCFLWHCPARHRDWGLPSALPYGARTFLPPALDTGPLFQRLRRRAVEC